MEAIDAGYAAFVFTNASPSMPVWGGRTPFLGTSPFAFGAPGGDGSPPIILDMATSVVARGKIRRAMQTGEAIPAGWALDADGRETTDARRAYEGIVLPLGGPKGSGLSLMMEIVAGVMSGAAYGGKVGDQYRDLDRQGRIRAGLDVFDIEPLPADHPLRTMENTVLTPHLGYVTEGVYAAFYRDTVDNIRAWREGAPLRVLAAPKTEGRA
jgi:LDH2 family malate/lactate/ureidoglycolate dehydrogenase